MAHPLNRQQTTLARQVPSTAWRNIAYCAFLRYREASLGKDYGRADNEWGTYRAASVMADSANMLAFPTDLPDGIVAGDNPRYDGLRIDSSWHIRQSLGSRIEMPDYLDSAICDSAQGWKGKLASYLQANDDENKEYTCHSVQISGDLSSDLEVYCFVPGDCSDQYWTPFYAVADGVVYDCTDTTIADCDLLDVAIGWHVCGLDGEDLETECRTDRYSQGYSSNPTATLAKDLEKGSDPVWHHGFSCFVGKLSTYPWPVKLYPQTACYSG